MKDTAPKELGILAVAALFGAIAWVVSFAVFDFAGFAAVLIGAIVATITAIVLWFGWRDAAAGPMGPQDFSAAAHPRNAQAKAEPAATQEPAVAVAASAPVEEPAPKAAPAPKKAEPKKAEPKAAKAKPVAADGKPEMLSAPRGEAGDDLKQIKGVGPKMEGMLNTMGVWHFDQIASWRKKEVEWVDANLEGFKGRVTRDEWVKQAKVLAKGGATEFSKKVEKGSVY